ncbi:MAG: tetratricopeptide repeat protein [Candidatus Riflebacteria bacterium]|nr:tetratricopeptide repeat protein [Candidatus Riflebacteria bacterium]
MTNHSILRHRFLFFAVALTALWWAGNIISVTALELSEPLRQASEQMRSGHFDEARRLAQSVQSAFPREIEPMLLLGEIEIAAGRIGNARTWFRLASGVNRSHPLVILYKKFFDEIEHRRGPLNDLSTPLPSADPAITARSLRRGWFESGGMILSPRVKTPVSGPVDKLGVASAPSGVLVAASTEQQAVEAMGKRHFLHAYLLYAELVRDHPQELDYLFGKASAALAMGRATEARMILLPLYVAHPDQSRIAELLVQSSRAMSRREIASSTVSINTSGVRGFRK